MPELKMSTEITHFVSDSDLEKFLSEVHGKKYEIIGSANDTDYHVEIYPPDTDRQYMRTDEDDINEFLEDNYVDLECGSFSPALQHAADKGLIPYGNYVVTVSW